MKNIHILVVEDERIVSMDIKNSLTRLGYSNVSLASSGEEALDMISSVEPDLVLMDILLRGPMDGVETARKVRERYDIPIIYITAYADEMTLQRAKVTEPYGYILKPFQERELHTTIEMALYKHKVENELRENEERYRRFFEEDLTGDFISSADGLILACNKAFAYIFGFASTEEAMKSSIPSLFPVAAAWEEFRTELIDRKKLVYYERELRRIDGKPVYVVSNLLGAFDDAGKLTGIQGYIFDDTKRKKLEQQFLQSQKMEAIGRLAGGIAHDFNNLLTVITGYSEFILSTRGADESMMDEIREIKLAGERASLLTRQLLAFSRNQVLQPKIVDLNGIVSNIETMLRRLIGENIDLKTGPGTGLYPVRVDPGQIEQVLMNLVVNARDAMPRGGKLIIETDNLDVDEITAQMNPDLQPGSYVMMSICDNGTGMDEETKLHLFEPFYTTKARGEGTGLGLSTVYGIVTQSNGHIRVQSEPGRGTTVRIYLPKASRAGEEIKDGPADKKVFYGTETILVVEDEEVVRSLIGRMLRLYGYDVIEAGDGDEALKIIRNHPRSIQLIISDMVMPGLSGPDLVRLLRPHHPETRILYISGYTDSSIQTQISMEKDASFMQKPFKPEELSLMVRRILDSPPSLKK